MFYMKPLDLKSVKMKNLLGILENPTIEDLLYEIVEFMDNEKRYDGEFKKSDVNYKTRARIGNSISDDLEQLVQLGYIEKTKYSNYKVIKHKWES